MQNPNINKSVLTLKYEKIIKIGESLFENGLTISIINTFGIILIEFKNCYIFPSKTIKLESMIIKNLDISSTLTMSNIQFKRIES